ncbi:hypothetical protein BU24DRAFT_244265 [Aaosphaeria arxii CBS 175.79]|uniref:Uncharacterized protein n=1 Tax=Aaosphaeria arxii CBS 175.79 TaxID=1450172 RepID=A0A6A5XKP5_9PLEO|nr:uncharacterized protein BU24DRAFT_244265 [Aaosphaeria arxii CBS 175.79]KAF2013702.1 hypothetical protein BU24DRAFT_244265 [Aaosphaeria arxii CBS 175.79]
MFSHAGFPKKYPMRTNNRAQFCKHGPQGVIGDGQNSWLFQRGRRIIQRLGRRNSIRDGGFPLVAHVTSIWRRSPETCKPCMHFENHCRCTFIEDNNASSSAFRPSSWVMGTDNSSSDPNNPIQTEMRSQLLCCFLFKLTRAGLPNETARTRLVDIGSQPTKPLQAILD